MRSKEFTGVKTALYVLGCCLAVLVLAAAVFVLNFDINAYKPRIEAAASDATGMEVRINGRMKLTLFPGASVSLENLLMQNRGEDIASAKRAALKIELRPLLRRELVLRQVVLDAPEVFITRDKTGRFNFETSGKKAGTGRAAVESLYVTGGHFLYLDEKTRDKAGAAGCDMRIRNLSWDRARPLDTLSFEGGVSCREVDAESVKIQGIHGRVKARGGMFEADPVSMKVFGGDGAGRIEIESAGESPKYHVALTLRNFRFEEVLAAYKQKKVVHGRLDLMTRLEMEGRDYGGMMRMAQGELSLRGHDLQLDGIDIDRLLKKYEKSRGVGIIDVGSFFVLGPLGPLLTKSYEFGGVYEESLGGKSQVRVLVSDWKINNGIAEAKDVAFSTSRNRVAFKGRLDFVHGRYENVTVAVLDEKGCAKYSERVHGRFRHPEIEKPGVLATGMGPVLSLFEKGKELITGRKCEVFYAGSVK